MGNLDWIVMSLTLLSIIGYGMWHTRRQASLNDYILGGNSAPWWVVGLSVMATQASAITFISTPGQAFHDGLGFVQFYFGLPIAMVIICLVFLPIYKRLNVYTAYSYLEQRFDVKTRTLTAMLFLVQRGLAAGITIYAPSIILSSILGWDLNMVIVIIGILVTAYTLSGGTKAVNVTQKLQMAVIFGGLIVAFIATLQHLPDGMGLGDALQYASMSGKTQVLDFSFDLNNKYTVWSGLIGGTFLALSYFGTDQSQVQRYLSSKSLRESQIGLVMNGLLKVPLQFFILLIGVLVFVVFQSGRSPIFFNETVVNEAKAKDATKLDNIEQAYQLNQTAIAKTIRQDPTAPALQKLQTEQQAYKQEYKATLKSLVPDAETNDKDYVFLHFILNYLPRGLIGLLIAMILCAAMSSTASELNALAATTSVDIYQRLFDANLPDSRQVLITKGFTLLWGIIAILFASYGTLFENLIQFVNIIGSIFYGTILGVFLVGFLLKSVQSNAVFIAAIISEAIIIYLWWIDFVPFLWLNLIGCMLTMGISWVLSRFINR